MKKVLFGICIFTILSSIGCKNEELSIEENEEQKALKKQKESMQHLAKTYAKLGIDTMEMEVLQGLEEGAKAPEFVGTDQMGNEIKMSSLTQDGPLVVIFYRGYWCPVCNRYLSEMTQSIPEIQSKGAKLVAVTPELPDNISKTINNTGLTIPVISDPDGSIMDAYGVKFKVSEEYQEKIRRGLQADIKESNGANEAFLPVPATYIIDEKQRIKFRHFDPNYSQRVSAEDILANL